MKKIRSWLRKRLSTYATTAVLLPIIVSLMAKYGLEPDQVEMVINAIVTLAMTYIGGQSVSDFAEYWNRHKEDLIPFDEPTEEG